MKLLAAPTMSGKYGSFSDNSEDSEPYDSRSRWNGRDQTQQLLSSHRQRYKEDSDNLYNNSSTESDTEHEDDFGVHHHAASTKHENNSSSTRKLKTGRERRKKVARGNKGGDFYEKRRKRRVYFCTLAGEIDVGELKDHLLASSHDCAWRSQQAGDALILVRALPLF